MSHSTTQNTISPLLTFSPLSLQPFTHQPLEWSVAHTHWSTPPSRTLWKMLTCCLRWVDNSHLCLNYINEHKGDLIHCECYLETRRLLSDKVKSSTNVKFYYRLSVCNSLALLSDPQWIIQRPSSQIISSLILNIVLTLNSISQRPLLLLVVEPDHIHCGHNPDSSTHITAGMLEPKKQTLCLDIYCSTIHRSDIWVENMDTEVIGYWIFVNLVG